MHVTVLIVLMVALGLVATPLAIRSEGHIIGPTEHQAQADQVSVLKVEGMTWAGCEAAVMQAAKSVEGVKDCKASYKTGTAEVTYDPSKTTPEAIAKVISQKTGYKATAPRKPRS